MSQEEEGAVHRKRAEARRKATVRKLQWTLAAVFAVALLSSFCSGTRATIPRSAAPPAAGPPLLRSQSA